MADLTTISALFCIICHIHLRNVLIYVFQLVKYEYNHISRIIFGPNIKSITFSNHRLTQSSRTKYKVNKSTIMKICNIVTHHKICQTGIVILCGFVGLRIITNINER